MRSLYRITYYNEGTQPISLLWFFATPLWLYRSSMNMLTHHENAHFPKVRPLDRGSFQFLTHAHSLRSTGSRADSRMQIHTSYRVQYVCKGLCPPHKCIRSSSLLRAIKFLHAFLCLIDSNQYY
eukprot:gene2286-1428_t